MPDNIVRVVASVIRRGDRFLVCRRPHNKRHGGLWEFPGGKCETGESDLDAVTRELSEELGVNTKGISPPIFEIRDCEALFLIVFFDVEIGGEPVCIEHLALGWHTLEEMLELGLAPSDRQFVNFLHNHK
jgi:mutator protein MutT